MNNIVQVRLLSVKPPFNGLNIVLTCDLWANTQYHTQDQGET